MPEPRNRDPVGSLLVIIELTELRERVAPHGLERWALDCARRALGVELPDPLDALRGDLRDALDLARRVLRAPDDEVLRKRLAAAVNYVHGLGGTIHVFAEVGRDRQHAAAVAVRRALDCVGGQRDFHAVAHTAQAAFAPEDRRAEADAQARRLLVRTKLLPSGAELLVRLDYAESRGLLPSDRAAQTWLDHHRALLMAEDEDGRFAVTLRHMDALFDAELERAP